MIRLTEDERLRISSELALLFEDYPHKQVLTMFYDAIEGEYDYREVRDWSFYDIQNYLYDRLVDEYMELDDYTLLDIYQFELKKESK